jgi:predicted nuclease with TOPRIM domain
MEHWQIIINLVGGAGLAAIGWFCREILARLEKVSDKVHEIEVDLPRNYVRQDQVESKLDKIDARFDKLDAHITKLFEKIERNESRNSTH